MFNQGITLDAVEKIVDLSDEDAEILHEYSTIAAMTPRVFNPEAIMDEHFMANAELILEFFSPKQQRHRFKTVSEAVSENNCVQQVLTDLNMALANRNVLEKPLESVLGCLSKVKRFIQPAITDSQPLDDESQMHGLEYIKISDLNELTDRIKPYSVAASHIGKTFQPIMEKEVKEASCKLLNALVSVAKQSELSRDVLDAASKYVAELNLVFPFDSTLCDVQSEFAGLLRQCTAARDFELFIERLQVLQGGPDVFTREAMHNFAKSTEPIDFDKLSIDVQKMFS